MPELETHPHDIPHDFMNKGGQILYIMGLHVNYLMVGRDKRILVVPTPEIGLRSCRTRYSQKYLPLLIMGAPKI